MENNNNSPAQSPAVPVDIKQRLIEVASVLFAENTFEGTSVREIASKAQVNLAMISYYFGGKEGLYLECIAQFARGRVDRIGKVLTTPQNAEEFKIRFRLFFETMMSLYTSDKHLVRIIMREAQTERNEEFTKKVMTHMHPVFEVVENFFKQGVENQILKKDTNAHLLASMTMALISHPCIMERAIYNHTGCRIDSEEYQTSYIKQICDTFFAGVLA